MSKHVAKIATKTATKQQCHISKHVLKKAYMKTAKTASMTNYIGVKGKNWNGIVQ